MAWSLQPLRIPHGWEIKWNTFSEDDPTEPEFANGYYFGGVSLFLASHRSRRLTVEMQWHTEAERPASGHYRMRVLKMVEVSQTSSGDDGRGTDAFHVDWQDPILDFFEASRPKLIAELEAWLSGARDLVAA